MLGIWKVNMKIEKIKKVGKKYNIILDDNTKIKTYDDVILNNGLLYHSNIDADLLNTIDKDTSYYDIYYKTINYIMRKVRSEKEINEFIDKANVSLKDKNSVISKLKEIGLINDLFFTKAYISDKINLSSDGPYKIKKDLLEHDIPLEVIDEEMNKIDSNLIKNKIKKLIDKKTKNSNYSGYYLRQKVLNDLINLGYDKESINEIYNSLSFNNSNLIKKEYDKLYKKLSLKYSDKELQYKIKTKLYQKGFTTDEINSIDL